MANDTGSPVCRIGTSGWNYSHWRGHLYPPEAPSSDWFDIYADVFSTVEINYSFYRLPSERVFDRWRNRAPPGFCYAIKANRYLTHIKRLEDCNESTDLFLNRCRLLGPSLGPILFQLPPNWRPNVERLSRFVGRLPTDLRIAFEFRDNRWFTEPVRRVLEAHAIALCVHDLKVVECPVWITAPFLYQRFHEPKSGHGYGVQEVDRSAERIREHLGRGTSVFAYFNNDAEGHAVHDARRLRDRVCGRAHPGHENDSAAVDSS